MIIDLEILNHNFGKPIIGIRLTEFLDSVISMFYYKMILIEEAIQENGYLCIILKKVNFFYGFSFQ